jgi:hypothetical protein
MATATPASGYVEGRADLGLAADVVGLAASAAPPDPSPGRTGGAPAARLLQVSAICGVSASREARCGADAAGHVVGHQAAAEDAVAGVGEGALARCRRRAELAAGAVGRVANTLSSRADSMPAGWNTDARSWSMNGAPPAPSMAAPSSVKPRLVYCVRVEGSNSSPSSLKGSSDSVIEVNRRVLWNSSRDQFRTPD